MDVIDAITYYVKQDAAVTALAGTRIFPRELPKSENASMPRTAAVLKRAGGGLIGNAYQHYGDVRIDVDCYAATRRDADYLFDAVASALKSLKRETVSKVLLHWARESSGGSSYIDPDTDWAMCVGSFQVLSSPIS